MWPACVSAFFGSHDGHHRFIGQQQGRMPIASGSADCKRRKSAPDRRTVEPGAMATHRQQRVGLRISSGQGCSSRPAPEPCRPRTSPACASSLPRGPPECRRFQPPCSDTGPGQRHIGQPDLFGQWQPAGDGCRTARLPKSSGPSVILMKPHGHIIPSQLAVKQPGRTQWIFQPLAWMVTI